MNLDLQKLADYAAKALEGIGTLISLGQDATAMIEHTKERLQAMSAAGRGPTQEEWSAQDALIKQQTDQLNSDA